MPHWHDRILPKYPIVSLIPGLAFFGFCTTVTVQKDVYQEELLLQKIWISFSSSNKKVRRSSAYAVGRYMQRTPTEKCKIQKKTVEILRFLAYLPFPSMSNLDVKAEIQDFHVLQNKQRQIAARFRRLPRAEKATFRRMESKFGFGAAQSCYKRSDIDVRTSCYEQRVWNEIASQLSTTLHHVLSTSNLILC